MPDAATARPELKWHNEKEWNSDLHEYLRLGLHMYGAAVRKVKVGERVVLPFNVACGFCKNCERGFTNYCLTMQPEPQLAGAAYGFADMGPYQGGQAEYLRVPYGDFNCLRLGEDAAEKELDYVMLADIFPTGWHATELAGVYPGDSVVIYGAGPVRLMAAYSAREDSWTKVVLHPAGA